MLFELRKNVGTLQPERKAPTHQKREQADRGDGEGGGGAGAKIQLLAKTPHTFEKALVADKSSLCKG